LFTLEQLSYYRRGETMEFGIAITDVNLDVLKEPGCTVYFDVTRMRATGCATMARRGERKVSPEEEVADDRACLRPSEQCYWGNCQHAEAGADIHICCNKYFCSRHEHIDKGILSGKCPMSLHQLGKRAKKKESKKGKAAAEK
jgi:hypothetical protein